MAKRRGDDEVRPSEELRNFTDRDEPQRVFFEWVDIPSGRPLPLLMFYGVGGMGKSWLLQRLRERLRNERKLPLAFLDLDPKSGGARYFSDSSKMLAEIWRQLDVECPRFELALSMYLFKIGEGDRPLLKHSGKTSAAWELVKEGGQKLLEGIPFVGFGTWLAEKAGKASFDRIRHTPTVERLLTKTGNEDYLALTRLTAQEIAAELMRRLGKDLEESLPKVAGKRCQAVIFLDTFETVCPADANQASRQAAEEPARQLALNLTNCLVVMAGQNRLDWEEIDDDYKSRDYLDQHLLGGLSQHDALDFLAKCGIRKGPLADAILDASLDEQDSGNLPAYFPNALGLCVDIVTNDRARGIDAEFRLTTRDFSELARRFRRSLGDDRFERWITRLAHTARFDENAARAVHSATANNEQEVYWSRLSRFSFFGPADDPGWFRLHNQMSTALRRLTEDDEADARAHHTFWRAHWSSRSQSPHDDYAALAWSHWWALSPQEALQEWNAEAKAARQSLAMSLHRDLVDWWSLTDLESHPPRHREDAEALVAMGAELWSATLGDRHRDLGRAIAAFNAPLVVYRLDRHPQDWAMTQDNLGNAYADLPTGDRGENLEKAIHCYQAALRVYTETAFPQDWAMTQNNLGNAYGNLPTGDRGENLEKAIHCYQAALRVRTEAGFPKDWASTQNNLGNAYLYLPTGDRGENLPQAIQCYQAALRVCTETAFPQDWAMTQNNLGIAYADLPTGNRGENLRRAIECYLSALRVYTETAFPQDWAMTQNNLGVAYADLPTGNRGENLQQAIQCYQAALRVRTEAGFPQEWAATQNNLGSAYADLPTGDRGENLRQAIQCHQAALRVRTEAAFPQYWATTQNNLGEAYADLPTGDRGENLRRAIDYYKAALTVFTEKAYPHYRAIVLPNLELARAALEECEQDEQRP